MDEKYPCSKCGMCCRNIGHVMELQCYDLGNGICKFLENNLCSIYYNRPLVCRVDYMYERYFKEYCDKSTFFEKNMEVCRKLKEQVKKGSY